MARSTTAIEQDIRTATAACVEETKSSKPFGGFFTPRKKVEPGCEQQARSKYAAELQQAQAADYNTQQQINGALTASLTGDGMQLYITIGIVMVLMIIIAIILA